MYIKINVAAGEKREVINKTSLDHYDISVREPAERNLANKRILDIVREMYPKRLVRIVSGHHSPSKILSVDEN